ncbi:MAG: putative glycoside hydrolase [Gammaproteobacteria bacterium]|nr:putative glycoside hydrolase [Gammaproteobacteria bacterium]
MSATGYPRILGMNIGGPIYYDDSDRIDELSRHDVVILGFYNGWEQHGRKPRSMLDLVRTMKAKNPGLLVGQYTILQETQYDPKHPNREKAAKLDKEGWWLVDANGDRVQWTDRYRAWDINVTSWVDADRNGQRYSEWLADYDYATFFEPVPEFDIWYFDNALSRPAVKRADWDLDGRNERQDDAFVEEMYRVGNVRHWARARELRPDAMLMANSDDLSSPEYRQQLEGAFLEAIVGLNWSTETKQGWVAAMERYRAAIRDTRAPHMVTFNVHGRIDDYATMRFGLASALLEDGYYAYSEAGASYRSVPWFDEFDVDLGQPVEPPQAEPYEKRVYRRVFEKGMAIVNPTRRRVTVDIEPGYRRFLGSQDSATNDGTSARSVAIPPRDGLLLVRATSQGSE